MVKTVTCTAPVNIAVNTFSELLLIAKLNKD